MIYLWGVCLFIFLFTVPKQEKPEDKIWTELEESITVQPEKKVEENNRQKMGEVDWDKVKENTSTE